MNNDSPRPIRGISTNDDRNGRNGSHRPPNYNQFILQSKLRKSASGIEMLDFTIPLGMMELHCSCPIPDEGTDGAPVYVHVRPARPGSAPRQRRLRPEGEPRPAQDEQQDEQQDEDYGNRGAYGS